MRPSLDAPLTRPWPDEPLAGGDSAAVWAAAAGWAAVRSKPRDRTVWSFTQVQTDFQLARAQGRRPENRAKEVVGKRCLVVVFVRAPGGLPAGGCRAFWDWRFLWLFLLGSCPGWCLFNLFVCFLFWATSQGPIFSRLWPRASLSKVQDGRDAGSNARAPTQEPAVSGIPYVLRLRTCSSRSFSSTFVRFLVVLLTYFCLRFWVPASSRACRSGTLQPNQPDDDLFSAESEIEHMYLVHKHRIPHDFHGHDDKGEVANDFQQMFTYSFMLTVLAGITSKTFSTIWFISGVLSRAIVWTALGKSTVLSQ